MPKAVAVKPLKTRISPSAAVEKLRAENEELHRRLEEAEETIAAIRTGAVDALVVEEADGHRVYTLEGAERPYRLFVEEMQQGAATLHPDGTIAWCNAQLAKLLKVPPEKLLGAPLHDFVPPNHRGVYDNLLWQGQTRSGRGEAQLQRSDGGLVPAFLTFNALPKVCGAAIGVLVTDLTTQRHHEQLTAAHEQLRRNHDTFFSLIENAPFGVYVIDAEFRLRQVSAASQKVFSNVRPLLGRDFAEVLRIIWSEPFASEAIGRFRHTLETGEPYIATNTIEKRHDSAELESYDWRIERVRLPDGQFGVVCYFYDITERTRAEEVLRESERRFREMIDAIPAAIYTTDAEGRLTHFNSAAVAFSGRVPELGTDHWCISWKLYHADGTPLPHDECPMAIALKEGRTIRGVEAIAERPDGTRVWFTPYPTPLRDREGKIVGGINMLLDITERKQAEEARAKLAAIVDSSDDAIISKTLDGIVTSWNAGAERLLGYRADEMIGHSIIRVIPTEHQGEETEILKRLRRQEHFDHFETVRMAKDGRRLQVSLSISPMRDASGRVIGASKIMRDITERKQAEEALRAAQIQLQQYAHELEARVAERTARLQETVGELEAYSYSIAHDMRAPLRAMTSFSRLVQTEHGAQLDETAKGYLGRVVSAAQRLDRLVTDVLTYSRVSRMQLDVEPVDLEKLLDEAIRNQPEFQPPRVEIEIQTPLLKVIAHEPSLMQCVNNLLSNAVKFVSPGVVPRVRIRTESMNDEVRIWFEDNGIGIAAADMDRIFSLFGRLHPVAAFDGTGIGLTIVRKAVQRMGGTVGVESQPGRGSQFWIQLKRSDGE